jgi:ankyrin repeat protein
VNTRLRRAIVSNDLSLVKRIVHNNPTLLQNPDYEDKSNTSLHLAAKHGHYEIALYLIDAGHEDEGISRNSDWDTPLMLASEAKQVNVGEMLIAQFPRCVPWTNRKGMDAVRPARCYQTENMLMPQTAHDFCPKWRSSPFASSSRF